MPATTARPRRRSTRCGAVVIACGLWAAPALAAPPAAAPPAASTPPTASVENDPVRRDRSVDGASGPNAAARSAASANGAGDVVHVVLALSVVVGLIFGLRWAARKMALVPDGGRNSRAAVQVLTRTPIAPKQQVLLLKVGGRVLVVADSGAAGMQLLTQFTDANEVAALVGEVRSTSATAAKPAAKSFASMFGRAAEPFADKGRSPTASPTAAVPPLPGEVAGLLDKVRGLRQQFEA